MRTLYFSTKKTWEDLKSRVIKVIRDKTEIAIKGPVSKDQVKLWSCSPKQVGDIEMIVRDPACDTNAKFSLQGYCLEQFQNHQIEQIVSEDDEAKDVIIIEVVSEGSDQFHFKSALNVENPEIIA